MNLKKIFYNSSFRMYLSVVCLFIMNMTYVFYNGYLGISTSSAWFTTMTFYYFILAAARLLTVLYAGSIRHLHKSIQIYKEYRLMYRIGIMLLLLIPALCGTVILMNTAQYHISSYSSIAMITISAYTFFKIILSIINFIKAHTHASILQISIRNISIADAAASVLTLQSQMLASFDTGMKMNRRLMTSLAGAGICIVYLYLGISMIITYRRKTNGKIKTR